MTQYVGVAETKRRFSELLDRVGAGERIVVTRRGRPAVALVPPDEELSRCPGPAPTGFAAIAGALDEKLHVGTDSSTDLCTLDAEHAEKLARMTDRMHVQPGMVAGSLLSSALDEADPDTRNVAALLGGIPGAYERAQMGFEQAKVRQTVVLDEL